MDRISRFILIDAPQEKVFALVADYRTLPKIQPQFRSVKALGQPDYGLGATIEAKGSLHGLPLEVQMTITEFDPPNLMVSSSKGGVNSISYWRFSTVAGPDGRDRTRAALAIEYSFAIRALSLIGGIVHKELETMTADSLRLLKQMVEGGARSGSRGQEND